MSRAGRRVVGWVALGLAGLAIAVAVGHAATQLVSQHVALSGEPRRGDVRLVAPPSPSRVYAGEGSTTNPDELPEPDDD